ncbi:MAG: hypothetical protein Q9195_005779 [Heterodermia aff. obscurata]
MASSVSLMTPQEYVDAVAFHSTQANIDTLYPGHTFEDLSLFLKKHSSPHHDDAHASASDTNSLATLLTLGRDDIDRQSFTHAEACIDALLRQGEQKKPHILFLKGYQSPTWSACVGAFCSIDPQYFNSHLSFRCRRHYYSSPTLPSASKNIIKLRITTIGSREGNNRVSERNQNAVDQLRLRGTSAMRKYQHELFRGARFAAGDSVVRSYTNLDEKHFILEQDMTICLSRLDSSWIVSTDVGNDLSEGPEGPWLTQGDRSHLLTLTYPTIQHHPRIAFKLQSAPTASNTVFRKFPQSASLLPQDYGRFLDKQSLASDPFYALHDLFRFAANSEVQFLNLMEAKIADETSHNSLNREKPTLTNLLFFQELLETHLAQLRRNVKVIEQRESLHWPRTTVEPQNQLRATTAAAEELLEDAKYLETHATALLKRCETGMSVLMNDVMLAESKQAMSQASKVAKLTLVAFFYIPLSFTTSFFGMNVVEIASDRLSVWTWFATSVPIFVISLLFLFVDRRHFVWLRKGGLLTWCGKFF